MLILVICFVIANKILLLSFPNKSTCLCNYSPFPFFSFSHPIFFLSPTLLIIRSLVVHFILVPVVYKHSPCLLVPPFLPSVFMSSSLFSVFPQLFNSVIFVIKSICKLTFLIDQTYFRFEGYLLLRFATPKIELQCKSSSPHPHSPPHPNPL